MTRRGAALADRRDLTGRWVSKVEAADWTGMSLRTINTWVRDGKVQWQYTAGGHLRIWEPSLWRPDHVPRTFGRPFTGAARV
jgi:hypothetical protein